MVGGGIEAFVVIRDTEGKRERNKKQRRRLRGGGENEDVRRNGGEGSPSKRDPGFE